MYLFKLTSIVAALITVVATQFHDGHLQDGGYSHGHDHGHDGGDHTGVGMGSGSRFKFEHPRDDNHEKRDFGDLGFTQCDQPFFKGKCIFQKVTRGEKKCYKRVLAAQGSYIPDRGLVCTVFISPTCRRDRDFAEGFTWPGSGDYANDHFFINSGLAVGPNAIICDWTGTLTH